MKKNKKLIITLSCVVSAVIVSLSFLLAWFLKPTKASEEESETKAVSVIPEDVTLEQMGGAVYIENGSTYTMRGGSINGTSTDYGGAIFVATGATFIMNGGSINNCDAIYGGAIFVQDGGICIINGGTINGCDASHSGGAIYAENGATLEINAGVYKNNTAVYRGGAISTNIQNISIKSAQFIGNKSTSVYRSEPKSGEQDQRSYGGAIFLNGYSCVIEDCYFEGNSTAFRGGAIHTWSGQYLGVYGKTDFVENYTTGKATDATGPSGEGGAICVSGKSLNLGVDSSYPYTGTFDGNYGASGSAIYITGSAKVVQKGGTFRNNKASANGGCIYLYTGAVYNVELPTVYENNEAKNGGVFYVGKAGTTLNTYEGEFRGNKATNGGVIYQIPNTNIKLVGGQFIENEATRGGVVYLDSATLEIQAGKITENTANYGGGVYASKSTLNISGGEISKNLATRETGTDILGGGLYLSSGTTNIYGGKIIDNTSNYRGGGIYTTGTLAIYNNAIIAGNTSKEDGGGIFVASGTTFIGTNGSSFAGTKSSFTGIIANNSGALGGAVAIYGTSSKVYHHSGIIGSGTISGVAYEGNKGVSATAVGLYNGGTYNLAGGTVQGNIAKNSAGSAIGISHSKCVVNITAGLITDNKSNGYNVPGLAIRTNTGTVNMSGGTISNHQSSASGIINVSGTFNFSGGSVISNSATSGGAFYVSGTLNITGGLIKGNNATNGGAIYSKNGTINVSTVTIEENWSKNYGGALYGEGATISLNSGSIQNNYIKTDVKNTDIRGAGVYSRSGNLTINGGTISNNYLSSESIQGTVLYGGGVYVWGSTEFKILGGTIQNNQANYGAGVYANETTLTLESGAKINDNVSVHRGAGLYLSSVEATINGGEINRNTIKTSSNSNTSYGVGVYATRGTLIINGGEIKENKLNENAIENSAIFGGGVYSTGTKVELNGGKISNNTASLGFGGGFYFYGGSYTLSSGEKVTPYLTINNCEISSNNAMMGGGLYATGGVSNIITVTGGKFINNNVTQTGGGIEFSGIASNFSGSFIISGNTILENVGDDSHSSGRGAGIALNNGTHTISGGEIINNKVLYSDTADSAWGGGIYMTGSSILYLEDGAKIGNNIVAPLKTDGSVNPESSGANLYINRKATVVMKGGEIFGDGETLQAGLGGGITNVGQLFISGGKITNCVAKSAGGIVSYGGFIVKEQSGASSVDGYNLSLNKLVLTGTTEILNCKADVGSSLAVGNIVDLSGNIKIDGTIAIMETNIPEGYLTTGERYWVEWVDGLSTRNQANILPKISISDDLIIPENIDITLSDRLNLSETSTLYFEFADGNLNYENVYYTISEDSILLDNLYIDELNAELPQLMFIKGLEDLIDLEYIEFEVGYGVQKFPNESEQTGYELIRLETYMVDIQTQDNEGNVLDIFNQKSLKNEGTTVEVVYDNGKYFLYVGNKQISFFPETQANSDLEGYSISNVKITNSDTGENLGSFVELTCNIKVVIVLQVAEHKITVEWMDPEKNQQDSIIIDEYQKEEQAETLVEQESSKIKYNDLFVKNGNNFFVNNIKVFEPKEFEHYRVGNYKLKQGKIKVSDVWVEIQADGTILLDGNVIKINEDGSMMFNNKLLTISEQKLVYINGALTELDENNLTSVGGYTIEVVDSGLVFVNGIVPELEEENGIKLNENGTISAGENTISVTIKKTIYIDGVETYNQNGTVSIDGYSIQVSGNGLYTVKGNSIKITKDGAYIVAGDVMNIKSDLTVEIDYNLTSYDVVVQYMGDELVGGEKNGYINAPELLSYNAKTLIKTDGENLMFGSDIFEREIIENYDRFVGWFAYLDGYMFNEADQEIVMIDEDLDGKPDVNGNIEESEMIPITDNGFELVNNITICARYILNDYDITINATSYGREETLSYEFNEGLNVKYGAEVLINLVEESLNLSVVINGIEHIIKPDQFDWEKDNNYVFSCWKVFGSEVTEGIIFELNEDIIISCEYERWFTYDFVEDGDNSYYEISAGTLSYENGSIIRNSAKSFTNVVRTFTNQTVEENGLVKIPRTYGGHFATKIKNDGFKNRKDVKYLYLSTEITEIGNSAFSGCSNLSEVNSFANIKKLGQQAFYNCTSLTGNYEFSALTSWNSEAFRGSRIEGINLYNSKIKALGERSFSNLSNLTNLVLPQGLTELNQFTIYDCPELTSIFIPASVEKIAFHDVIDNGSYWDPSSGQTINKYKFKSFSFVGYSASNKADYLDKIKITLQAGSKFKISDFIYNNEGLYGSDNPYARMAISINCSFSSSWEDENGYYDIELVEQSINTHPASAMLFSSDINVSYEAFNASLFNSNTVLDHWHDGLFTYYLLESITPDGDSDYNHYVAEGVVKPEDGKITIPSKHNGFDVLGVKDYGFKNNEYLTEIFGLKFYLDAPEGMKGVGAFMDCDSLIAFEERYGSSSFIPAYAFYDCDSLYGRRQNDGSIIEGIFVHSGAGEYAFYDCDSITKVSIMEDYNGVKEYAFANLDNLVQVEFSNHATSGDGSGAMDIKDYAFSGCPQLNKVDFGGVHDVVNSIGSYAFDGAVRLKEITITDSVETIGYNVFNGTTNLVINVTVGSQPSGWSESWLDGAIDSQVNWNGIIVSNDGIKYQIRQYQSDAVVVGLDETAVNPATGNAFIIDYVLDGLIIPDVVDHNGTAYSVTEIYPEAFNSDKYLEPLKINKIILPMSVKVIGYKAFKNMGELTEINLNHIAVIDSGAFLGCLKLETITLPSSIRSISDELFKDCISLKSITIPASVITIGDKSFANCSALTAVNFESLKNINKIGKYAFAETENLTNITLPTNIKVLSSYAFYSSGITQISIPASVAFIGEYIFADCLSLNKVEFATNNKTLEIIEGYAFKGCEKLTSITLPSSLTTIMDYVFFGCEKLSSVTLPNSLSKIGDFAFAGCISLSNITIPSYVKTFGKYLFSGLGEISITYLGLKNAEFINEKWLGNCVAIMNWQGTDVFSIDGVYYQINDDYKSFKVTEAISTIEKVVKIKENIASLKVVSIEDYAFRDCYDITRIVLPETITSLGTASFMHCISLRTINLQPSLTEIPDMCFYGCELLRHISLPDGVTYIGDSAFWGCDELIEVNLTNSLEYLGFDAFRGCSSLISVKIPKSIESIPAGAFYGCSSLTEVILSEGLIMIGEGAFRYCESLLSITIPKSVKILDSFAFWGCDSMKFVNILSIIVKVQAQAFTWNPLLQFKIALTYAESTTNWAKNWIETKIISSTAGYVGIFEYIVWEVIDFLS